MKKTVLLGLTLSFVSTAVAKPAVFTAAQSKAGQTVYTTNCQGCHGNKLQGGAGPALVGKMFLQKWSTQKVDDLHYIIHSQMPLNKPGSLTDAQYLNVTTFILQSNGVKPSKKPLTKADLTKYTVGPK